MLFNLQGIKQKVSNAYTGGSIYNYKFRTDNCTGIALISKET